MRNVTKILLVEDNEGDIVLTRRALSKTEMEYKIDVVRDGEEALMYLRKNGIFQDAETPDLILLDINLPKIDGMDVLKQIKGDGKLRTIPVIMLTSSDSEKDILMAYSNYANWYITKPKDFKKFIEIVQAIKDCLISIVKFPNHQASAGQ
jgi:CheY-like chemotaxis protein